MYLCFPPTGSLMKLNFINCNYNSGAILNEPFVCQKENNSIRLLETIFTFAIIYYEAQHLTESARQLRWY